jgi:hypothetical protein
MKSPAVAVVSFLLVLALSPSFVCAQADGQTTFASAKEAEAALAKAVQANDAAALKAMFGPDTGSIVSSGDDVADSKDREFFVSSYETKHTLTSAGGDQYTLNIGKDLWPLPIPLVHAGDKWYWDGAAGQKEILYRRIGRNELDAINVCKGVVAAQKDYSTGSHDGNPVGAYAQRIVSEPGKQNGLYWEVKEGEPASPAGPMLASANAEGYDTSHRTPYHGYYYRLLKNGKGFGFLAYPAEYRASGVMTFMTSQNGKIYQKDLGEKTSDTAQQITDYKVDSTWTLVK